MERLGHLSNLQIELLKLFNFNLKEKQLVEIKDLLSAYFAKNISKDVDQLWEKEKWSDKKMDELKSEHLRTEYK